MPVASRRATMGNTLRSGRNRLMAAGSALSIFGARICAWLPLRRRRGSITRRRVPGRGGTMRGNRSVSLVVVASFAVALIAGCSQAPAPAPVDTRKADEAAIRAAGDARGAAFEEKDIKKSLSFYGDDRVFFVPKGPAVIGKDALRKAFQPFMSLPGLKATTSGVIFDVAQSGDLAFERGNFTNTITEIGRA